MQEIHYSLGNSIRDARERKKLTQSELAEKVSVTTRTILDIENHRGNPRFNVLYDIIRVLNIPADLIFHPRSSKDENSAELFMKELDVYSERDRNFVYSMISLLMRELKFRSDI